MKRISSIIIALIAALAALGAATQWMPLMRPILDPRLNYAQCPPRDWGYPDWVETFRGHANGGETGVTVIAWLKYASTNPSVELPPFVTGSCTAEAARPTLEGGAGLTNLVTGTLADAQTIDVSGGAWARECLPVRYDVPATLAGTRWQYGCYCINLSTDTPLTLSVADTELYIPATNNMIRNVQGSTASRYVIITPESTAANVQFGIGEMPLHQFVCAQSDGADPYGGTATGSSDYGGLAKTWRMFAFRARIISDGKMVVRMDGYAPDGPLQNHQCVTQDLFRVRATFEKDAVFRLSCAGFGNDLTYLSIGRCMEKMIDGWIADGQVERIRDLDAQELARQGELEAQ